MRSTISSGFHLVELLVALAIIGVLLALALPSYRTYSIRADRADAVRQLAQAVQCQEEARAVYGAYDTSQCLPGEANRSYRFSVSPMNEPRSAAYTLQAIPIDSQVGKPCGTLSIDQFGSRTVSDNDSTVLDCWGGR